MCALRVTVNVRSDIAGSNSDLVPKDRKLILMAYSVHGIIPRTKAMNLNLAYIFYPSI